jgi:hypothetical protein
MWGALSDGGRVCSLLVQLLLDLTKAVTLGSKSRRTHDYILLSFQTPPTWRPRYLQVYLRPAGTRWFSYTPGHWVPFSSSHKTRRAAVENIVHLSIVGSVQTQHFCKQRLAVKVLTLDFLLLFRSVASVDRRYHLHWVKFGQLG